MENGKRKMVNGTVIVGAGISGLTCAHRLRSLGIDTVVIESSTQPGGVIRTDRVDGYLIERGPNSTQGTEEFQRLVAELDLADELLEGDPKAPAFVYFGGRLHAVPNAPAAFIRSRLLSPLGKLRILAEPFVSARRTTEEESVAEFARRRIGVEAAERLVAPFVSGIYAGDAGRLSVQASFPRLADLEANHGGLIRGMVATQRLARKRKVGAIEDPKPRRKRLCSFVDGMASLPNALASRLGEDLLLGCEGISISRGVAFDPARSLFKASFERAGHRFEIACKRMIVAAPALAAADLVAPMSQELSELLRGIDYAPLAIVHVGYQVSSLTTRPKGFGFLVAPGEGMNILGCVWNSSLFSGRAPDGQALMTVFVGGARNPDVIRLGDAELVAMVRTELQRVLGINSEPHVVAVTRYERSIPQYNLGHAERVRKIRDIVSTVERFALVGNYLHGVSVGDCIKEAEGVAREMAR